MKLSFIIPVYNGANFIVRCLDSIYNLKLPQDNYEVIVVDDCSTDDTREIVAEYGRRHSNLSLLCQPQNHRQGAARNRGLRKAKGEYIAYIDADDFVLTALYQSYEIISKNHVDMVYGYMEVERDYGLEIVKNESVQEEVLTGAEYAEKYYNQGVFLYPPSYIYRRQFLLDIKGFFIEDRQHEDRDWLAYVLSQAQSVMVNPNPTYRYVCNPSSTCRALSYSTVFDHTASGIRHMRLSKQLQAECPNLSHTLYIFGVDEIYKNLRLRNLSKFRWADNKHLYDAKHLKPLIQDLRQVCQSEHLPLPVWVVAYLQPIELLILAIASPIAALGRKIVTILRK